MPTESKSETPRTDAIQKYTRWIDFNGLMHTLEFADIDDVKLLEKELNEAKQMALLAHQRVMLLAKENEQLRLECQLNNQAACLFDRDAAIADKARLAEELEHEKKASYYNDYVQAAKENKVMREALKAIPVPGGGKHEPDCDWIAGSGQGCDCGWNNLCETIANLKSVAFTDTSKLIVLTRNELIAEIEKMPCGCHTRFCLCPKCTSTGSKPVCHRCQWLARVKE